MKTGIKTIALILTALTAWSINSFAQGKTVMYVMKNDTVVFQSLVSDIDNVTFDEAVSGDALMIQKNDGSPDSRILLNDIQQLSFSDDSLSVKTSIGSKMYAFNDIAKLLFDKGSTTGIHNPSARNGLDVIVSVSPSGEVTVESPIAIKSLIVYGIDGKMISRQHFSGIKMQCPVSLQNNVAGVYLLRVETEQGSVVKKVIKPLNK